MLAVMNFTAAGDNCATGGVAVTGEGGTRYVCNGTDGVAGSSVTLALEPAGDNCAAGGVAITDTAGTQYVCDGVAGPQGDVGPLQRPDALTTTAGTRSMTSYELVRELNAHSVAAAAMSVESVEWRRAAGTCRSSTCVWCFFRVYCHVCD